MVVSGAVQTTLEADGLADAMNFTFVPWGNAYFNSSKCATPQFDKQNGMYCWIKECGGNAPPADCFTGTKICQHGGTECSVDTLEGCAIRHYPDFKTYMPFIFCLEGKHRSNMAFAEKCATQAKMDYGVLKTCATGPESGAVDALNARMTAKYGSSRLGTPWIVVNGKYVEDTDKLLQTVCSAITGPKPSGCR